jgi:hypothetical protein
MRSTPETLAARQGCVNCTYDRGRIMKYCDECLRKQGRLPATATSDDKRPLTQVEVDARVVALLRRLAETDFSFSPTATIGWMQREAAALLPDLADRVFAAQDEAAATSDGDGMRKDWLTRLGEMDDAAVEAQAENHERLPIGAVHQHCFHDRREGDICCHCRGRRIP